MPAHYSLGKGIAAFLICGFFGFVAGLTLVPVTAILAYFVGAVLLVIVVPGLVESLSGWMVNVPIVVVFAVSSYGAHKIIARAPAEADAVRVANSARDANIGVIGFALFYGLAWLAWVYTYWFFQTAPL